MRVLRDVGVEFEEILSSIFPESMTPASMGPMALLCPICQGTRHAPLESSLRQSCTDYRNAGTHANLQMYAHAQVCTLVNSLRATWSVHTATESCEAANRSL